MSKFFSQIPSDWGLGIGPIPNPQSPILNENISSIELINYIILNFNYIKLY